MTFKPLSNPLMIVSDNPAHHTGLARIGRDLASLAATLPEFSVAYLGRGERNRRAFPWVSYTYHESGQWGENYIEEAWNDFSGGEPGIIFTLDDPSRRLWFAQPHTLEQVNPRLSRFLGQGRNFRKWAYMPIDGTGPNGETLGMESQAAVAGYDRVLAASEWGMNVLKRGGRQDADWLPHGLFMDKFHPDTQARSKLDSHYGITVGCVMANQARKDFPAAFECAVVLKQEYGNRFRFWLHTDLMIRYWNVYALAADYGVSDCLEVTMNLPDEQMALRYSACDCTILPSGAEGFGYPIAESLACGTACIVADYAAAQELVPEDCRVSPVTFKVDTQYNVRRAVLSGYAFAQAAKPQIERKRQDWEFRSGELAETVQHLSWDSLKHTWIKWLREGLR